MNFVYASRWFTTSASQTLSDCKIILPKHSSLTLFCNGNASYTVSHVLSAHEQEHRQGNNVLTLVHYALLPSAASVTDDDEQPNCREDDGRCDPEPEVALEGEVVAEELGEAVAEELGSPGLLADNQIRDRT